MSQQLSAPTVLVRRHKKQYGELVKDYKDIGLSNKEAKRQALRDLISEHHVEFKRIVA